MTPLQVKQFLQQKKRASVHDIARRFSIDIALATVLLRFWVARGMCSRVHTCQACPQACESRLYYEWNSTQRLI